MPKIPKRSKRPSLSSWEERTKLLHRTLWNLLIKLGYVGNDYEEPSLEELVEAANQFDPRYPSTTSVYDVRRVLLGNEEDDIPF